MCGANAMRKCWQEVSSSWSQGLDDMVYILMGVQRSTSSASQEEVGSYSPPPPSSHKLIKQNIKLKILSSENLYRGLEMVPVI